VGDYNNDGFDDLFLTYWGQNVLYRNNGNGTFTDVTREAGLLGGGTRWGAGCTFLDYNRDGYLDLFVSNYVEFSYPGAPRPGEKPYCFFHNVPVNCGPRGLPFGRHSLYRNNKDGTFSDVSEAAGISRIRANYGLRLWLLTSTTMDGRISMLRATQARVCYCSITMTARFARRRSARRGL